LLYYRHFGVILTAPAPDSQNTPAKRQEPQPPPPSRVNPQGQESSPPLEFEFYICSGRVAVDFLDGKIKDNQEHKNNKQETQKQHLKECYKAL